MVVASLANCRRGRDNNFFNKNIGLLNEVEKALLKFGFHPERRLNAVRLRKKNEVFAFKQLINFRQYP